MSYSMARRRCGQFTKGRTNMHDVDCSSRPSLVMPELIESVRQSSSAEPVFHTLVNSPLMSRSLLHEIVLAEDNISAAIFF